MKKLACILALAVFLLQAGCDKNDENTINSLPKDHDVFPIFHLRADNGYTWYGVDSVILTVTPSVGWPDDVDIMTDTNGFIGTMASGTFILDIDTTITVDQQTQTADTVIDTISTVCGFSPATTYTLSFTREEQFTWDDYFRAVYAYTIDSTWTVMQAETLDVAAEPDFDLPFDTVIELVKLIDAPSDTAGNPPDSIHDVDLVRGFWFNHAYVLLNPDSVLQFEPDSIDTITESWGYWLTVDTFFMSTDSANWCDIAIDTIVEDDETTYVEQIEIKIDTAGKDLHENYTFTIDTIYHYAACPEYPGVRDAVYRIWGWSDYDTTIHAIYPDTTKSLIFDPTGVRIVNHVTHDTNQAAIYLIDANNGTSELDSLKLPLTMPAEEVYPHYEIIFRDEN